MNEFPLAEGPSAALHCEGGTAGWFREALNNSLELLDWPSVDKSGMV